MVFMFTGCVVKTEYIYNDPEYPKFSKMSNVPETDAYIWQDCLFMNDKNTSLCGEQMDSVVTTVKKLRINEKTCGDMVETYENFVVEQENLPKKENKWKWEINIF